MGIQTCCNRHRFQYLATPLFDYSRHALRVLSDRRNFGAGRFERVRNFLPQGLWVAVVLSAMMTPLFSTVAPSSSYLNPQ